MKKFAVILMLIFAAGVLSEGCGGGNDDLAAPDLASEFKFTIVYKLKDESAHFTGIMDYTGALSSVDVVRADFYATVHSSDSSTYEFHPASEDLSAQAPARVYTMEREYLYDYAAEMFDKYYGRVSDPRIVLTFRDGSRVTILLDDENVAFEAADDETEARASEITASSIVDVFRRCGKAFMDTLNPFSQCAFNRTGSAAGANIGIPGIMFVVIPLWLFRPRKRR